MSASARHSVLTPIRQLAFGPTDLPFQDEFEEFKYRFLIVLLLSGAFITGLFVLGMLSQLNPVGWSHTYSMSVFTLSSFVLWLVLRGRPQLYYQVGWTYEFICLLEYTSALLYVSVDEMRALWFVTNISGVFILLGQRAGWLITVLSIVGLILGNGSLERPYSANAMATMVLCMVYLGVYFHFFMDRSISYFTRMREFNAQLKLLASQDPLTGLLNARFYYQACDHHIRLAERRKASYSVLFVDLDHFKSINDTYGHAAGDEILKTVSKALKDKVRDSDLVGRIGGEEFSIFLPDTRLPEALQVAEKVRQAIEGAKPSIQGQPLNVTASIGVATNLQNDQSIQSLQQQADAAMYQAKQQGRNRVSTLLLEGGGHQASRVQIA